MIKRLGIRSIQTVNHMGSRQAGQSRQRRVQAPRHQRTSTLEICVVAYRRTESLTWVKWQYGILTERQTRVCTGLCATGTEWTPGAHLYEDSGLSSHPSRRPALSQLPRTSTMQSKSQRPKDREGIVSTLNIAIDGLGVARDALSIPGAKAVLGIVTIILTMIKVCFVLGFRWSIAD